MDRFEAQEAAIHKFRAFASEANVHVTLVIHPRKERDGETLAMHSVFGSAKATQEADTVLILQNVNGSKAVDVRKNRFDGGTGSVPLVFDPAAMMYREKGSEPIRGGIASLLSARDADSDTLPGLRAAGGAAAVSAEGARAALQALGLVSADKPSATAAPPGTHAHVAATSAAGAATPAPSPEARALGGSTEGAKAAAAPADSRPALPSAAATAAAAPAAKASPAAPAELGGPTDPASDEMAAGSHPAPACSDASAGPAAASTAAPAAASTAAPAAPAPSQGAPKRQTRRTAVPGGSYAVAGAVPAVRRPLSQSAAAVVVDGDEDLVVVEPDAASADVTTEWPEDDILTG